MVYWLVAFLYAGTTGAVGEPGMHVGTFKTQAACMEAARQALLYKAQPNNRASVTFLCVQANEDGTNPPGG